MAPCRRFGWIRVRASILLGAIVVLAGCSASSERAEVPSWLEAAWPEADMLFQRDRHWVGGDGASSVDLGNGRVLWLFGDSWIDPTGRASRNGATMVSNALAIQRGYDPSRAEAEFFWGTSDDGAPGAFFPDGDDYRFWPGSGVLVDGKLLLFLMEVHPASDGLGFAVTDWQAVLVANPEAAPPGWAIDWIPKRSDGSQIILGSGSVLVRDSHVYAFGAREPGPNQDVYLARWSLAAVTENQLDAIEWWAGVEDGWLAGSEAQTEAVPVFGSGQTEFTVHFDDATERFVAYQTLGFGPAVVVRRFASELPGPWSAPDTVFTPPQGQFPNILVYQGKAHAHLEGGALVVTYCTNSIDFADHLTQSWLYFPRFVRLRTALSP